MKEFLGGIIQLLVIYLPAMVANGVPVILKGKRPIDMGKNWFDGRRILGDGKTWEGLVAGVTAGLVVGALEWVLIDERSYILYGLVGGLGAMMGDILGSFIKRRMGIPRGEPLPIIDQLDFYFGATLLLYLVGVEMSIMIVTVLAIIIYFLHRITNHVAYRLGLKRVPW